MPSFFDPLWVITSYYNPAKYETRRDNFHVFRKYLNAPLMVVELARSGEHHMTKDDGDIVLSLVGEDRIWQKERLLNIALAELPQHVEYVAWVDCDVIFEDEDWAAKAKQRLSRNDGLLQLFETSVHLPRAADIRGLSPATCARYAPVMRGVAIASALAASEFDENEAKLVQARDQPNLFERYRLSERSNCYGMAWAAHRSTIAASGFYDRNVVGGGDAVQAFAAIARLDNYWDMRHHTQAHKRDQLNWVEGAKSSGLFSTVDALGHRLYHMWHGSIEDRDYRGRYKILHRNDFDPAKDIAHSANGTWAWSDPHGVLANEVGAYFFSRREDGAT